MLSTTRRIDDETLLEAIEQLTVQQAAAVRVLYVADDPMSSALQLSQSIGLDPVLTAQVMRLANSAFYGLCGRVRSADFAVTILGFTTVRSLAAAHVVGAIGEGAVTPKDFWEHAASVAAGCAHVAPRLDLARPEAFSMGLLHDLGAALLCRIDPERFQAIENSVARPDSRQAVLHERKQFGMDHAAVASIVLGKWRFPEEIVAAIASHHERPGVDRSRHKRCLAAGHALGVLSQFEDFDCFEARQLLPRLTPYLQFGDVDPHAAFDLSRVIRVEALGIAASFRGGSIAPDP